MKRADYRHAPHLMQHTPLRITWLKIMEPSARNGRRMAQRQMRKDRQRAA